MDRWGFKILLLLILLYLGFGQIVLPGEISKSKSEYAVCDEGWEWLKKDGSRETVSLPARLDVPRKHVAVIRKTLSSAIQDNMYLMVHSLRQDMRILVDGHLRNEYSTKNTRIMGTTSSTYFIYTELRPEDVGKELRIEFSTDSSYSGMVDHVYIGDQLSLNRILMSENIASIVVSMIMFLIGAVVIIVCLILGRAFKRHILLEDLGWGIVVLTLWTIINSPFRQFMFHNLSTASDVTFMLVMLIPYPFLVYLDQLQSRRYRLAYMIMEVLLVADAVGSILLVIIGMEDFSDTILLNIVACGLSVVLITTTTIIDTFTGKVREYIFPAVGLLGIGFTGVVECYFYLQKKNNNLGYMLISAGLLFMLVMAITYTVQDLMRMDRDKIYALQSSKAQSQFLASMSHEIRTPINAVLGMDEMILRESDQKEVLEYAADIQSAGKSLLTIINDILDFSKVQSEKMELVPVEYSLSEMIRGCFNMVAVRAARKDLRLVVKNNPDLPGRFYGDEVRVRQIIVNFLTNAVKYTEKGEVTLIVDGKPAELTNSKEIWNLKFSVRDTGIGIREEERAHLFDAFTRVDVTRNRNVEGTGLGLALSQNLALLMKGKINVDSVYGEGSTFTLELPQKAIGREKAGAFRMEESQSRVANRSKGHVYLPDARILVVDDVAVNLKVFTSLLKKSGMTIDTAESGEECLSRVQEWKYDLIFLDHMMPVMDGIEVMKHIKQMEFGPNAETPVIMLTANAMLGAKESYLKAGFADYLSKPIQIEELEALLEKYVGS